MLQAESQGSGLPAWAQALAAVAVFVIGGGTIGPWLASRVRSGQLAEQKKEMAKDFATSDDLNGLRLSLEAQVTVARADAEKANAASRLAVTNAENALQTAQRIDTESKFRWESIAKEMAETARTLERVTERVQGISDQMIRFAAEADARFREKGGAR